jgi:magnesium transporter
MALMTLAERIRARHTLCMASAVLDNDDLDAVLLGSDDIAAGFLRLLPHPADIVEILRGVDLRHWPRLLRLVADEAERAETVALLDEGERQALLALLSGAEIGTLVKNLETDDATDVLEDLNPQEQEQALQSLLPEDREAVEGLLRFAPDSAGGLMQSERAQVKLSETVADAIRCVRTVVEDNISVQAVYVVDDEDRLVGTVDLSRLVLNKPERLLADLVEAPLVKVLPDTDQEQVARIFKKYGIYALPVVDKEGRLLGSILHDDVIDVVVEEAEEDALKQAGTSAEELLYRDRVFPVARIRLPWLLVTMMGSLVSGLLIHAFAHVFREALVLASFVPVITAMGGNVGTQSATILTRGLATGRVSLSEVPRILLRELRVGLVMGVVCGVAVGVVATFFFGDPHPMLGVVVCVSMMAAMVTAATIGTLAPATMLRLGVDPAIASGPFVTTANDGIGIVLYMLTSVFFLEHLRGP